MITLYQMSRRAKIDLAPMSRAGSPHLHDLFLSVWEGGFVDLEMKGVNSSLSIGSLNAHTDRFDFWPGPILLKRLGIGRGLTLDEAKFLRLNFEEYYSILGSLPIRKAELYSSHVVETSGEAQLWSLEGYISGESLDHMWRTPRLGLEYKFEVFGSILNRLSEFDESQEFLSLCGYRLPILMVGADIKPVNIVIELDGIPSLVDFYPPLKINDGLIDGYSSRSYVFEEFKLIAVCATRVGIVLRLIWLLLDSSADLSSTYFKRKFVQAVNLSNLSEADKAILNYEIWCDFNLLKYLYHSERGA